MKIIKDDTIPELTTEEQAEIREVARSIHDNLEEFKRQMEGVNTVILSPQVEEQLKEMGMSPDELIAMLMGKAGKLS